MPSSANQQVSSPDFAGTDQHSGEAVVVSTAPTTPPTITDSSDAAKAAADATKAMILVVEDDPRSARMVSAHLQMAGYRVTVAHSATEAQQSTERGLPDLILCDVCLPDMDGIQLTRWIRSRYKTANLPIALITSSDDIKILAKGLEAGADDFLAKPVNSLELPTRVRSLLRTKMLVDEIRAREQAALPFGRSEERLGEEPQVDATVCTLASVVVVEDNPQESRLLEAHLGAVGCRARSADSAAAGLALIRGGHTDLIVLDLLLPDCSGYDLIASIKNDPSCAQIPILVVSAMANVKDRVKALELGADDFIVKGFDRLEFEARVRRLLRLKLSLDQLNTRCNEALQLAITDSLTGLYSHGFMQQTLQRQLSWAERYGKPYSIIFGDLDHFKQINDKHGHAAGDAALRAVAQTLQRTVRTSDNVVRYGGEEFVVLLPHTLREDAVELAERMRRAVSDLAIALPDGSLLRVTMSLGVACYPEDATDAESLVVRGDEAMYLAKQAGRNRVVSFGKQLSHQGAATL